MICRIIIKMIPGANGIGRMFASIISMCAGGKENEDKGRNDVWRKERGA